MSLVAAKFDNSRLSAVVLGLAAFCLVGHGTMGAGLGLAIARALVQAHGGEITLDSREGHGTTVRFTLPAS